MKFDVYLFDLDNSLLHIPNPKTHFDQILQESLKRLTKNHQLLPRQEDRDQFWTSGENYIQLLRNWGVEEGEFFWKIFDEVDFDSRRELELKGELYLYPDVKNTLEQLYHAGKKTAIVSNTADYIMTYFIEKFGIKKCFYQLFALGCEKDESLAKPSPEGILSVLKEFHHEGTTKTAIMVGDSIVDVYAAKRANICACLIERIPDKYPDGFDDWEYKPDIVIKSLEELID